MGAITLSISLICTGGERVIIDQGKLSIELPDGWTKSKRNAGNVLIGWESSDQTGSVFIQKLNVGGAIGMVEMMDGFIDNFADNEALIFEGSSEIKTGQVQGVDRKWPAVFATVDAQLEAKPKNFEMKFYLFIFDTGSAQYYIQGSSTKPIWDVREKQIMSLIRSIVAKN